MPNFVEKWASFLKKWRWFIKIGWLFAEIQHCLINLGNFYRKLACLCGNFSVFAKKTWFRVQIRLFFHLEMLFLVKFAAFPSKNMSFLMKIPYFSPTDVIFWWKWAIFGLTLNGYVFFPLNEQYTITTTQAILHEIDDCSRILSPNCLIFFYAIFRKVWA